MTAFTTVMCGALAAASAQSPLTPDTIVLKAARTFDATSERLRTDAAIVVRDGRIVVHKERAARD